MEPLLLVHRREEVLEALVDGPRSNRDLVDSLGASRSTVNRAVRDLAETGFVRRVDGGYRATAAGRLALQRYRSVRRETAALGDHSDLLAALPVDCDLPPAAVADGKVSLAEGPAPYRVLDGLHGAVREADEYRLALPRLTDPRHLQTCFEHVVTDDGAATLVADPDLLARLREEFPQRLSVLCDSVPFTLFSGATPSAGLAITVRDGTQTAWVVVYDDNGALHGVLRTGAETGVQWVNRRLTRATEAATDVTEEVGKDYPEGVVVGDATLPVSGADVGSFDLPVALDVEGFVHLSSGYFATQRVADPVTAWRRGLGLTEVYAGYSVRRTDADGRSVTGQVLGTLTEDGCCLVLGPPGSGKSTVCKRVACKWYAADRGPVLYRESDRGQAVTAVDTLVEAVEDGPGQPLVVVEDAARPDAGRVVTALERLTGAGAAVLLDARDDEWAEVTDEAAEPGSGPVVDPDLPTVGTPPLDEAGYQRIVEHFERTSEASVDREVDRLAAAVRDGVGEDAAGTPGELHLLLYRLATYADPLSEGTTGLEADVARVYDRVTDLTAPARGVCTLAVLLAAAGLAVTEERLAAAVPGDPTDPASTVDRAVETLRGRVLFESDGDYRTVHETWAAAYLVHLRDVAGDPAAREQAGRCVTHLLGHTAEEGVADPVPTAAADGSVARDGTGRVDATFGQVLALARERPELAPLFAGDGGLGFEVPAGSSVATRRSALTDLSRGLVAAGHYEAARAVLDRLDAPVRDLGLARVARHRGDPETATQRAEDCRAAAREAGDTLLAARASLERASAEVQQGAYETAADRAECALGTAEDASDPRMAADARRLLADVATERSVYDRASERYRRAREQYADLGHRRGEAACLKGLGTVAQNRADYDDAEQWFRCSVDLYRSLGDRKGEARVLNNLGNVAYLREDMGAAEAHLERSRDLLRGLGDERREAICLVNLANVYREREELTGAAEAFEDSLSIFRDTGDRHREALALNNLGMVYEDRGDLATAESHYREALSLKREVGDEHGEVKGLHNLADLAAERGNTDEAIRLREQAFELATDIGARAMAAEGAEALAGFHRDRGERERARDWCDRGLDVARETDADDVVDRLEALQDGLE